MAYNLSTEKKTQIVAALCEGVSIRSIERMPDIHRDTIMRLGVRMGEGCGRIMDERIRDLESANVEIDEIWGFIGKKQKRVKPGEIAKGDVWTFIALDSDTKLVPSYHVTQSRDAVNTQMFLDDLASRMKNRIQLSSDTLRAYANAVDNAFGCEVDYGQIVKTFAQSDVEAQRRYSPPKIVFVTRSAVSGDPKPGKICTSYIEKQNHTLRMHCRRLTNAFSKKLENFKAAVSLNFAYYNFCKVHRTIRCTPAMEAGIVSSIWTVRDLVNMIEP